MSELLDPRRFVLLAVVRVFSRNKVAGPRVLRQQPESVAQDLLLQIAHSRTSDAVTDFETFRIERARWTHLRRNFRTNGDQDRGNPFHFDFALDRHDRAVTDAGSTAGEDDRVSAGSLVDFVGNLRRGAFVHRLELHGVAHVADVFPGNVADETFGL